MTRPQVGDFEVAIGANAREGRRENGKLVLHHLPCPKWRIIILAKDPFTFDGHKSREHFKQIYRAIGEKLGLKYDPSCADPARLFFLHRIPENPYLPPKAWIENGKILDWRDFLHATAISIHGAEDTDPATSDLPVSLDRVDWVTNHRKIKSALFAINPVTAYGPWLQIGMAIHSCSGGDEEGLNLWDSWSQQDTAGYQSGLCEKKWRSFGRQSGPEITVATLYKRAQDEGWKWGTKEVDDVNVGDAEKRHQITIYDQKPISAGNLGHTLPEPKLILYGHPDGSGNLGRNTIGVTGGQGGCGKTTEQNQFCCSIASTEDCTFGMFKFSTNGPVLAIFAEDDISNIERSIYRIRSEFNKKLDLSEYHIIAQCQGDPRLFAKDSSGNVRPTQGFENLRKRVAEIRPVYIVADSYSILAGVGEEFNNDGAFVVSCLSELCTIGDSATVMILAHPNKASLSSKTSASRTASPEEVLEQALDPNSIRGASSLVFNTRWVQTMTLVPETTRKKLGCPDGSMLTAYSIRKTNYSRRLELAYAIHDVQTDFLGSGTMLLKPFNPSCLAVPSDEQIKDHILELIQQRQSVKKRDFRSSTSIARKMGVSRDRFREFVDELLDSGQLAEFKTEHDKRTTLLRIAENG